MTLDFAAEETQAGTHFREFVDHIMYCVCVYIYIYMTDLQAGGPSSHSVCMTAPMWHESYSNIQTQTLNFTWN